jgi:hypothetical protein
MTRPQVRKVFLLASTIALSAVGAHADTEVTGNWGDWQSYSGSSYDGQPLCGTGITRAGRGFQIKFQNGIMFVQLFKDRWDIPNKTPIDVIFQVDRATPWRINAMGYSSNEGGTNHSFIEWRFSWSAVDPHTGETWVIEFGNLIKNGLEVKFEFPSGSEPPWTESLTGSTPAIASFADCVLKLNAESSSQPYSQRATQPYSRRTTQPF